MKNCFYKIIIIYFISVFFSCNINADLDCSSGIILKETSQASPAYFQAHMPICGDYKPTGEYRNIGSAVSGTITDDFFAQAEEMVSVNINSIDNKSIVGTKVPICTDSENVRLYVNVNCDIKYKTKSIFVRTTCAKHKCVKNSGTTTKSYINNDLKISKLANPNIKCKKDEHEVCEKWNGYWKCPDSYTIENGSGITQGTICYRKEKFDYDYTVAPHLFADRALGYITQTCQLKHEGGECECRGKHISYQLQCPIYECKSKNEIVNFCTPNFEKNGNYLYCVNPGESFSDNNKETAKYLKEEFNPKECEASYSTVDCGYSNILIEGELLKKENSLGISQGRYRKIIELALRLWGVHTNQAGFNGLGVSNKKGLTCDDYVYFMMANGKEINTYVESYNYFREYLLNSVRFRNNIDVSKDYNLFSLNNCNSDLLGVACGDGIDYKVAFALLANTIVGNDKMKEHLLQLYDYELSEEVESAQLKTDIDGNQYIELEFDDMEEINILQNQKINCNELDKLSSQDRAKIEPYCRVVAKFIDEDGNEIKDLGGGTPNYCYKNYCVVMVENFAICDVIEERHKLIKIKTIYQTSNSSKSINKYISCSSPIDHQIMLGFDSETLPSSSNNQNTISQTSTTTKEFTITDYRCAGKCDNYDLRGRINESCEDNTSNYNQTFNSSIKDPSIKCILNMGSPAIKNMYDYSDYFGVNTDFCKIYCSDEVEYYIADKVKATSGRNFYYDIEKYVTNDTSKKYLFSNIIKEKRTCVSEIYYNNYFANSINWKKKYDLGYTIDGVSMDNISQSEINSIKNIKTLLPVLIKKANSEGGRTENINKVVYDLYNCNFYDEDIMTDNEIYRPKESNENVWQRTAELYSKNNNYGMNDCVINDNQNTCFTMNSIKYDYGNKTGNIEIPMNSVTKVRDFFNTKVSYCTGSNCFAYDENNKDKEYDYPTNMADNYEYSNDIYFDKNDNIITINLENKGSKVRIPKNDYAMFEINVDVSFYNDSSFKIKPNGEVVKSDEEESSDDLLIFDKYHFPLDKDAYNKCESRSFLGTKFNRCNIRQSYNSIKMFFRNNTNDAFSNKVNDSKNFNCYVDVEPPGTTPPPPNQYRSSTRYRNVDTTDLFPAKNYDDMINWNTEEGRIARDKIEHINYIDLINDDKYLDYSITLTPTQINNIKEYNSDTTDNYLNEALFDCQTDGKKFFNCKSQFLKLLLEDNRYGTISKYKNTN